MSLLLNTENNHYCNVVSKGFPFPYGSNFACIYTKTKLKKHAASFDYPKIL